MFSNFQSNKQSHSYQISSIIKTNSIGVQRYVITALTVEERNAMAKNTYVRITALVIIKIKQTFKSQIFTVINRVTPTKSHHQWRPTVSEHSYMSSLHWQSWKVNATVENTYVREAAL